MKSIQFTDSIDWTKGKHTFQFGTDDRRLPLKTDRADKVVGGITSLVAVMDTPEGRGTFLTIPSSDTPPLCATASSTFCLPSSEVGIWNQLYAGTLGLLDSNSILAVRDGSLDPLPYGTPLSNTTVNNSFYFWGQDSWRISNSLTLNYGLAYGWQTPPTDILGRQTILQDESTNQFITAPEYLGNKLSNALQGNIYNPTQGYVPVNDAHHSVFSTDYGDLAPRVSLAWNPGFDNGFLGRISATSRPCSAAAIRAFMTANPPSRPSLSPCSVLASEKPSTSHCPIAPHQVVPARDATPQSPARIRLPVHSAWASMAQSRCPRKARSLLLLFPPLPMAKSYRSRTTRR